MDVHFCVEALEDAIARFGAPEIFNSDQAHNLHTRASRAYLKKHDIQISMEKVRAGTDQENAQGYGKGKYMDNMLIERLWQSLKYKEVYLKAYDLVSQTRQRLD